jgi:hypothetical protein
MSGTLTRPFITLRPANRILDRTIPIGTPIISEQPAVSSATGRLTLNRADVIGEVLKNSLYQCSVKDGGGNSNTAELPNDTRIMIRSGAIRNR